MSNCGKSCGGADGVAAPEQRATLGKHAISLFAVAKMDCAAEERMVRLALEPLPEVLELVFDLPGRRLRVLHDGDIAPITRKLEALGLGARLIETASANGRTAPIAAEPDRQAQVLKRLLAINALMFVIELGSGLIAQSTGLIADSLDMFADAAV